ncbi:MAG: hypothetical protein R3E75_10475 [Steroidobacteraceae bacterium]
MALNRPIIAPQLSASASNEIQLVIAGRNRPFARPRITIPSQAIAAFNSIASSSEVSVTA